MYQPRTDLALEAHELASKNKASEIDGIMCKEESLYGFGMTRVEINTEEASRLTGKPCGKYLTLHTGMPWNESSDSFIRASRALSALIEELCVKNADTSSPVLIAGLGNITITADAIGPKALEHVIVTRHIKSASPSLFADLGLFDVAALSPGVLSQTGVETTEIIKSLVDKISPSMVIAIDSLASKSLDRLVTTIQLSDTGIAPGSGMGNRRASLNKETLGVPVISIGIPTVVDAGTLAFDLVEKFCQRTNRQEILNEMFGEENEKDLQYFVTPKDTDLIISCLAKVIGYGINLAFHKNLEYEEMVSIAN
jgi:spore protease